MDSFCDESPMQSRALSKNEKKEYLESLFGDENAVRNLSKLAASAPGVQNTIEWVHAIGECPRFSIENVRYDNTITTVASYYYSSQGGGIESSIVSLADEIKSTCQVILLTDKDEQGLNDGAGFRRDSLDRYESEHGIVESIASFLEKNRVDMLIFHAWFDPIAIWVCLACHLLGVRFVMQIHGVFSHFLTVRDGAGDPWKDGKLFPLVPLEARFFDAVVTASQTTQAFFACFNPNTFFITNVVGSPYVDLLSGGSRDCSNDTTILWVGRFDPYKHPEDAFQIFAKVKVARPDAKLVIVGDTEDSSYQSHVRACAAECGFVDDIEFTGFADPLPYYSSAAVSLVTSEVEGYCMVLAESFCCGIPVVAYSMPYLALANCKGAAWVDQGDVGSASEQISLLLADIEKRRAKSEEERKFMKRSIEDSKGKWAKLITLLSSRAEEKARPADPVWETLFMHFITGELRSEQSVSELRSRIQVLEEEISKLQQAHTDKDETPRKSLLGKILGKVN